MPPWKVISIPAALRAAQVLSQVFLDRSQAGPGDAVVQSAACSVVFLPQFGHWAPLEASLGRRKSSKPAPHTGQWNVYIGMALLTSSHL